MNETKDDGATKAPEGGSKMGECMGRWRHVWNWVWEGGLWTSKRRCPTCGTTEDTSKKADGSAS